MTLILSHRCLPVTYQRIVIPPIRPIQSTFIFPTEERKSCTSIYVIRVIHSQNGVRDQICHDMIRQGFGRGLIRRLSVTEVEVKLVILFGADIELSSLARYFYNKLFVDEDNFIVDADNDLTYLHRGIIVYKTDIPNPECHSLDEELDDCVDGYSVISDK